MKHYRKELWFEIKKRRGFVNITTDLAKAIAESGIREGLLLCNAMHITASVFINDDESGLHPVLSGKGFAITGFEEVGPFVLSLSKHPRQLLPSL